MVAHLIMATATVYPRRDKATKSPHGATIVPLYLRITHGGDRARISLDLRVKESEWNEDKKRVRSSHDSAVYFNQQISDAKAAADRAIAQLKAEDVIPRPSRVKDRVQAQLNGEEVGDNDFLEFTREKLDGYERRGQIGTFKSYRAIVDKFETFWKSEYGGTLQPSALTVSLLNEWKTWLYEVKENSPNTVGKALRVLRTFYRKAQSEGIIDRQQYPWDDITIDSEDVEKELPTLNELDDLLDLWDEWKSDLDNSQWKALAYFLTSYYAGGMRFGDVAWLRWDEHLPGWPGPNARIKYKMEKTSGVTALPVVDGLREILEIFDDRRGDKDRVFPIMDGRDTSTDAAANQSKKSANSLVNKKLRKISDRLDIEHLSFHMSRNLAAYKYYKSCGDIRKTSKMLGHASIEQTEQYLKGFGVDLDDSFEAAFGD